DELKALRDRLFLHDEIPEDSLDADEPPYFRPAEDSVGSRYMMDRRKVLDGFMPVRVVRNRRPLQPPNEKVFAEFAGGSGNQQFSTTMAFTRLLRNLARDKKFGPRVVPIVPDEARTFGMDALFREFEIYAPHGQLYEPVAHALLLSYTEDKDGQILEEGITEAGGLASWTAAATSYATRGTPVVPFFIFYSMFGFQRVGDLIWAAADARARGFRLGATAGRTPLPGEGLQHQDGHSPLLASTVPPCEAYDPAFAYELAAIVEDGLRRMYPDGDATAGEDVFYYLTLYNENYAMPPAPDGVGDQILEGLYRFAEAPEGPTLGATVLFSGSAQRAAREAVEELAEHFDVGVELCSATSYKRLREEALAVERWNRLHPDDEPRTPLVTERLERSEGPIVAVSDSRRGGAAQVGRVGPDRGRQRLHAGGARPGRALGAPAVAVAGHGRVRAQRHPRDPAPV